MGLFSLLCCGCDAVDSADDKYNQLPSRTAAKRISRAAASVWGTAPGSEHSLTEIDKAPASSFEQDNGNEHNNPVADSDSSAPKVDPSAPSDTSQASQRHRDEALARAAAEKRPSLDLAPETARSDAATEGNDRSETADTVQLSNAADDNANDESWQNGAHDIRKEPDVPVAARNDPDETDPLDDADDADLVKSVDADVEADPQDDEPLDLTKIQKGHTFHPDTGKLLGPKDTARFGNKKCLILDLDETLVHSSFKYLRSADFVIPVEIENQVHHVYVIKRPGVDEFLRKVGQWYEVVVFTASVAKYGDPLLNKLDIHEAVHHRLFRNLCYSYQGNFIKNLSQMGRPLAESIIIDNSPASYIFHRVHSVPISSWFSDTHDNELLDLLPLLKDLSKPSVPDVSLVLDITI